MKSFHLVVSSPDGNIFDDEIVMLSVRGVDGELAVMAGHIPFVTTLVPSECKIEFDDMSTKIAHVDAGLLTVSADTVTLLSGSFKWINS